MSVGTKENNEAFARKMSEQLKQEQENECTTCPHKAKCGWYVAEHREQIEEALAEVLNPVTRRANNAIYKNYL